MEQDTLDYITEDVRLDHLTCPFWP